MSWTRSLAVEMAFGLCIAACGGPAPELDAATPDGGHDAGAVCRNDADCSDGLVCNGIERCTPTGCAAGTAMRCDDAIACTIDSCSEALAACVHRVPDVDGDGSGAATCLDATGTPLGTDCDDGDAARFPTNAEQCDAAHIDEDCDATTLGGRDDDTDGFVSALCCDGTTCGDDCDDTRVAVHVGATEVCNGLDDDCDGHVDEAVSVAGFVDADRDGYGDATMARTACGTAVGFSVYGTDCDDTNPAVHPGQPELCDGIDNDCVAATGIDVGAIAVTWYRDADGDGFGTMATTRVSCMPPVGYVILGTDCDDTSAARSPATAELCNGIDDDCNGTADFVIAVGDLEDDDRDGVPDAACADPRARDCDDRDPSSGPGAVESCDGRDNDCDTRIDEGATQVVFYRDADGDGFGTSTAVTAACIAPAGYARRGGDCDDGSNARFPGALESCNAVDDDCDVAIDEGSYASASCALSHATSVCQLGTCRVAACDLGWGDCSSTVAGCESDLVSSAAHCGGCTPCASGACVGGTCTPACTASNYCATTANTCAWSTCGAGTCSGGSVISCSPLRIDGHTSASTARAGTATGSPFVDGCGGTDYAIGMQAKVDQTDGHLFAVSVLCASGTTVPGLGRGVGSSTMTIGVSLCPSGSALSGADVSLTSGAVVGLRTHCMALGTTGTAAVGNFALSITPSTSGGTLGTLTGASAIDCAAGSVSTGMSVTTTSGVTSVQLACGPPSLAVVTTTPVLGGGAPDVRDCPVGQLPIAFTGDSTVSTFYDATMMDVAFTCGFFTTASDGHGGWTTSVTPTGGAVIPPTGGIGCCYSSHQAVATSTCPANQVIVGMSGVSGVNGPAQITIHCAPVLVSGDAASGFTVRYGTPTPQTPVGSGAGRPPTAYPLALCPQGTVAVGWATGNGEVVGGIALRCAAPPIAH